MHGKRRGCHQPVYGKERAYRGMQSLCAGYRREPLWQGAAPCWGQGGAGRRWRPLRQSRKSTDRRGAETRPLGGLRAAAPSGQG